MKRFFTATGKALAYFALFYVLQLAVSLFTAVALMFVLAFARPELDANQLLTMSYDGLLEFNGLVSVISGLLSLLAVWFICAMREQKLTQRLNLKPCSPGTVAASVGYGFGMCFLAGFLTDLLPYPQAWWDSFEESYAVISMGDPVTMFLSTVILAPVTEEIFFRGLVHGHLRRVMPVPVAAVVSVLLFAVLHGQIIWIVSAFVSGLALVWIYERTGNLCCSILVHMVNNLLSLLLEDVVFPVWADWTVLAAAAVCMAAAVVWLCRRPKGTIVHNS